jgi:hypothetical protein
MTHASLCSPTLIFYRKRPFSSLIRSEEYVNAAASGGESVHGLAKNAWKHKIKIARKAKE